MTIEVSTTSDHFLSEAELENPRIKAAVDKFGINKVVSLDAIRGRGPIVANELIAAIRLLDCTAYIQIVPIGRPERHTLTLVNERFLRSTCARLI